MYMSSGLFACCVVSFLFVLSLCIFMRLVVVLCLFLHFGLYLAAIPLVTVLNKNELTIKFIRFQNF